MQRSEAVSSTGRRARRPLARTREAKLATAALALVLGAAACAVPKFEIFAGGRSCNSDDDCGGMVCTGGFCAAPDAGGTANSSGITTTGATTGRKTTSNGPSGSGSAASGTTGRTTGATTSSAVGTSSSVAGSGTAGSTSAGTASGGASTSAGKTSAGATTTNAGTTTSASSSSSGTTGGIVYYISPTGHDTNPGTASAPWLTFTHAFGELRASNTLILEDGTYTASTTGLLQADCNSAPTGTAAYPVTIEAANERQAIISSATDYPISTYACSYWNFIGLTAVGGDDPTGKGGAVIYLTYSDHIVLQKSLAEHPNPYNTYAAAIELDVCDDCVAEDNEVYDFAYGGIKLGAGGVANIARRNFMNPRGRAYAGGNQSAEIGISLTGVGGAIVENNVVVNSYSGIDEQPGGATPPGNRFFGNILYNSLSDGFYIQSGCSSQNGASCAVNGDVFSNNVATGGINGFAFQDGLDVVFENDSSFGASNDGFAFLTGGASFTTTFSVVDSVSTKSVIGFQNGYGNVLSYNDAYSNATACSPSSACDASTTLDLPPALNQCTVYVPSNSPVATAGIDGGPMGANIVYEYEDGVLTNTKLWSSTGAFPCRALVTGINSALDAGNCLDINTFLSVGTSFCPAP